MRLSSYYDLSNKTILNVFITYSDKYSTKQSFIDRNLNLTLNQNIRGSFKVHFTNIFIDALSNILGFFYDWQC